MAIRITTHETDEDLTGKSHWWGFPDLPESVDFPVAAIHDDDEKEGEDLLTFICQIRLEDIAPYDSEGLFPHSGMLYFFAELDYFLSDLDAHAEGLGFWPQNSYKVIYTPETDDLHTHRVQWSDGSDACLPAESMSFEETGVREDGMKLLGLPYFEEVGDKAPGDISLLQLDEEERWGLRFYDCGMLNFLIPKKALRERRFDSTRLYFHSL